MAPQVGLESTFKRSFNDMQVSDRPEPLGEKHMGRAANAIPRVVVEDCEIIRVTDALRSLGLGL